MQAFQFKQFKIHHHRSGHKVGTDGVLLGAWTSLENNPVEILDIGTGSGLVALMMAQRSNAELIDAVEINENAYEECVDNFENSIWNDRLFCYHGDVKEFAKEPDLSYDLILSNPPFFKNSSKNKIDSREQARRQNNLTYSELIEAVCQLLSPNGEFSTVIPYSDSEEFTEKAKAKGIFAYRITHVKGLKNSSLKRSLIQFSFQNKPRVTNELILEISRHNYTEKYKDLVKDFYLKL